MELVGFSNLEKCPKSHPAQLSYAFFHMSPRAPAGQTAATALRAPAGDLISPVGAPPPVRTPRPPPLLSSALSSAAPRGNPIAHQPLPSSTSSRARLAIAAGRKLELAPPLCCSPALAGPQEAAKAAARSPPASAA